MTAISKSSIKNNRTLQMIARLGYAAKGLVYFIIGALAAKAAFGDGGATTDRNGAMQAIYNEPFGKFLLYVVIVGLLGYALWSFIRASLDTESKGSNGKGILSRIAYFVAGISYALLAVATAKLVTGGGGGKSSDASTQDWTAQLLKQPFGVFLIILIGAIVLVVAGMQLKDAYTEHFMKHFSLSKVSAATKDKIRQFGRFGLAARGIVFGIIGLFLIFAAIQHNASEAKGLGGALQELTKQQFGPFLLVIIAFGLMAYGVYSWMEARYRRL